MAVQRVGNTSILLKKIQKNQWFQRSLIHTSTTVDPPRVLITGNQKVLNPLRQWSTLKKSVAS